MKKRYSFTIAIFVVIFWPIHNSFSQSRHIIDSLKQVLTIANEDTNKVKTLDMLAVKYYKISLDTFQIYAEQTLKQSTKISYEKGMAKAYNKIAIAHYHRGDYTLAIKNYNEQFKISEKLGDKRSMAMYYGNIGLIHRKQGSLDKALKYYNKSFKINEEIGNKLGLASSYNHIGLIYHNKGSYDKAIEYYLKSLNLAEELGAKKKIAYCYTNIGNIYEDQSSYDKAIEYHLKSLKIYEELCDKLNITSSYTNIGIIYKNQGFYDKAIEYHHKSLKIAEKIDNKEEMAECFNNIGTVHEEQGSYKKAIEYYHKSLEICEELGLENFISYNYNSIGNIYKEQGSYDKANEYYLKSLKIAEELGDKMEISNCYINIGSIYKEQSSYNKAIDYYQKSLKIKEELGDRNGMSISYLRIASLNITLADSVALNENKRIIYLNKAVEYGNKSFKLAREIEAIPRENNAAKILMKAYKKLGKYKKAIEFTEIYITTQDSMFNAEKTKALQEMETKYETEKKNVEIKELKIKDIENQNIKRTFQLVIIFLIIISVLLIFFFRQKHKSNKILNEKNFQLNKLTETQSRLMSIISHDLKAPLSAFFSITSSLKSKIDILDSTTIDDYFNRMLNSALAVKLQLENLLVWSINQSTKINVNKSIYNLSVITQKVIIILEEFSKEKSIALINNINENIDIKTDGRLLSIVLNNLITNAIKFSDNNSEIKISATKDKGKALISVKDFGCGISQENIKMLFVGQNKMKHVNKGTGLGLIVCKDIVEKLGGKIWAESELGKGTTFIIEIHE